MGSVVLSGVFAVLALLMIIGIAYGVGFAMGKRAALKESL